MHIPKYLWEVLGALPSQVLVPIKRAARDDKFRQRSAGYAARADASCDAASIVIDAYERDQQTYQDSVDQSLQRKGVSGAHPDPDANWDAMSDGERESLVKAMTKCDARDHAISLARRLLAEMKRGKVDAARI